MKTLTNWLLKGHSIRELMITGGGAFAAISIIAYLSYHNGIPLLLASFGASAVLVFGMWESAASQPRNLVFGHVLSAVIGVSCFQLLGNTWYSAALAMAAALILMIVTDTIHPPGGATALICVVEGAGYSFILIPVLAGALILLVTGLFVNKCSPVRCYSLSGYKEKNSVKLKGEANAE